MAQRRMFNVKLCDSAKFLMMPLSTQALYFHLGLRADDEGIVEAFTVLRITGAAEDDLKLLVAKGYVTILNDEFVSYINDWNINNLIRADRKVESIYKDLLIKVKSIEPQSVQPNDNQMTDNVQPNDNQMTAQVSIGKDSLSKDSIDNQLTNKMVGELSKHYSDCFRRMIPNIHLDTLMSFIEDGMEIELVKYVMEYSIDKKEPWKYCKKVLENSATNMITTLDDFKANLKIEEGEKDNAADKQGYQYTEPKPTIDPSKLYSDEYVNSLPF